MINYNLPLIIYALLLEKKSSSGTVLSAVVKQIHPQAVTVSDDIVRLRRKIVRKMHSRPRNEGLRATVKF